MSGPIALHGGAEFLHGDEPVVQALLAAARPSARARAEACGPTADPETEPVRVTIIPAASSPVGAEAAVRLAIATFESVARDQLVPVRAEAALVVDRDAAGDATLAAAIAGADLIHLPGGDPALVPATLDDTLAWRSVLAAHARGAVIAGASAGAMALADQTWTPSGWRAGLGLIHGLIVVPHFQGFDPRGHEGEAERLDEAGIGRLGLDEQTAVLRHGPAAWRVVGEGHAHWFPPRGEPVVGVHDDILPIPF